MSDDRYTAVSNASSEDPHMMFSPEVFAMIGVDLVQKNAAPSHFAASAGMSSAGGPSTGGPSLGATEGAISTVESGVSGGSAGAPPSESAPSTASAANPMGAEVPRSDQRAAVRAAVAADPELIAAAKLLFAANPAGAFPDPSTPTGATRSGGPHPTSTEAESQIAGVVDTLSQQQRMIAHDQREIDLLTLIGRELKDMADHAEDYELDDFGLRALVLTAKASADRIAASSGNSSSSALLAPGSLVSPSRKRHAAARDFATSAYSSQSMQQSSLAQGLLTGEVASDPAAMAAAAAAIDTTIHRYFSADGVLVSSADTARRHDEIISDARGLYQQQLTVQRRQRRELFKQLTEARGRGEATTGAAAGGGPDVSAISVPPMPAAAASGSAVAASRGGSAGKTVSRAQTPGTATGSSLLPASASLGGGMSAVSASAYPLSRRPLVDLAGLARGASEGGVTPSASGAPQTAAAAGTQAHPDAADADTAHSEAGLAAVDARTTSTLDLAAPSDALAAPSAAPASKTLKQLLQEQRELVATAQRRDAGEYQPVLQRLWAYNAAVQDRMDQLLALPLTQHAQRSA